MEVVHPRCAGIDVSKKDAKVCVRIQENTRRKTSSTVTTWGSMTNQILALRDHLLDAQVTVVVMESTSDYWRPFYYLLESDFQVMLVNAREVRNVPGRKFDVSDSAWLADLGAHGLVRASFVPPEPIRQLRDLTRARTHITRERTREVQRLEKLLEDAGIKLSSVASDITGVSGRLMLQALIDQQSYAQPAVIADLAKRRMRSKIPELTEALNGHFTAHHAFMTRLFLDRIDAHTKDIGLLSTRIDELMELFLPARALLESIPGFSKTVAEIFIAETGADMAQFPAAGQLASWAGVSPGSNESAGRVKSTKTRPGNRYLKGALGVASLSQAKSRKTYFSAKFRHLAPTRGPMKAIVAVEHAMLIAAWHILTNGDFYRDPGPDYYSRRDPAKARARAVKQLRARTATAHEHVTYAFTAAPIVGHIDLAASITGRTREVPLALLWEMMMDIDGSFELDVERTRWDDIALVLPRHDLRINLDPVEAARICRDIWAALGREQPAANSHAA